MKCTSTTLDLEANTEEVMETTSSNKTPILVNTTFGAMMEMTLSKVQQEKNGRTERWQVTLTNTITLSWVTVMINGLVVTMSFTPLSKVGMETTESLVTQTPRTVP